MAKKSIASMNKRKQKQPPEAELHERSVKMTESVDDELHKAFNPVQNRHLWTMWRSAVTGRIIDETKSFGENEFRQNPLGRSLLKAPLMNLIQLDPNSIQTIGSLMTSNTNGIANGTNGARRTSEFTQSDASASQNGRGVLGTRQFIFYGVPRVVLKK